MNQSFPLAALQPVATPRDRWVALWARIAPFDADSLSAVFGVPDVFAALAPLDLVLAVPSLGALTGPVRRLLPPARVVFAIDAQALADPACLGTLGELGAAGYRVFVDITQSIDTWGLHHLYGLALDCRAVAPEGLNLAPLTGPHFAYGVDDHAMRVRCLDAGVHWLAGSYSVRQEAEQAAPARARVLDLLELIARDPPDDALEAELQRDPVLSYHLLRQLNSPAFAPPQPLDGADRALGLLGRAKLERWLQLLLYARRDLDERPSVLLPLAAQRAAQMESLCRLRGGSAEEQEQAFMAGVFSLLDVQLGLPMAGIADAVRLPGAVSEALLARRGHLGQLLALTEAAAPEQGALDGADVDGRMWWESQLHAYHWAIQVAANL
ncbi:MAG TPA: HDOD domain-containing protein [Telluria sp.]|nr:HDOD domain-containing protein [Telluria sp.]